MDIGNDLLEKIKAVIEPYYLSMEKPPFTEEQLAVIALVHHGAPQMTRQIFDWIFDNLAYYGDLRRRALWIFSKGCAGTISHGYGGTYTVEEPTTDELVLFRKQLDAVSWQYEAPLLELSSDEQMYFAVSNADAKKFLEPILQRDGDGSHFPFFRLPSELRTAVYECLFQYPSSGVMVIGSHSAQDISSPQQIRRLTVLSRSTNDEFSKDRWLCATDEFRSHFPSSLHEGHLFRTRPIKDILLPLLVSRQFYEEAMPVFYDINRFYFRGHMPRKRALEALAPNRRKHVAHLSIYVEGMLHQPRTAAEIHELLLGMSRLRSIDVYFHKNFCPPYIDESEEAKSRVLGMKTLRKLSLLDQVTMFSPWPTLKAMLKEYELEQKVAGNDTNATDESGFSRREQDIEYWREIYG